jgi:mono/diheme cytochrome c family protein
MLGWLKKRKETPVEERSYSGVYAFWSGVLFLTTIWAVWNEVETRRPWKVYQEEFLQMKSALLHQQLADARQSIDNESVDALAKQLSEAKAKLSSADARRMGDEINALKRKVIDYLQERAFEKSKVDAVNYDYESSARAGDAKTSAAARAERIELEKKMAIFQEKADLCEAQIDSISAVTAPWAQEVKTLQAQIDSLRGPVLALEAKLDFVKNAPVEIKQVILEAYDKSNWGMTKSRIDRCQTCHMGWGDSTFSGPAFESGLVKGYSSVGTYVGNTYSAKVAAPVLEVLSQVLFGEARDYTTDLENALGDRKADAAGLLTRLSKDREKVIGMKKVFGVHPDLPMLKTHSPEQFGCTSCHAGQGMALSSVEEAHGFEEHWDAPLLTSHYVEGTCTSCHGQQLEFAPYAKYASMGRKLYLDLGCWGCHENNNIPDFKVMKQGPSLRNVTSKLSPQWMYTWIKFPKAVSHTTRMPMFYLPDDDIDAVVTYLTQADEKVYQPLAQAVPNGDPAKGKNNIERLGCIGCHPTKEYPASSRVREGNSFGPYLSNLNTKLNKPWLFDWLRNPKRYHPRTRMPNLRLTDQEAADITAFILQDHGEGITPEDHQFKDLKSKELAAKGAKIIGTYGCYGCHEIKGFETTSKASVQHNDFGRKLVQQLFWGKVPDDTLAKVRRFFADSVGLPLGKSVNAYHDEDWFTWTILKLKSPRVFQTDAIVQRMPSFMLSDTEAFALSVFLRSLRKDYIAPKWSMAMTAVQHNLDSGRFFVHWNNCIGCHKVENTGGWVAERIKAVEGVADAQYLAPPIITHEGRKVQERWLYAFLRAPAPIRPWLKIRMPTFGFTDSMYAVVQNYFLAIAGGTYREQNYAEYKPDPLNLAGGQELFTKFQCIKCHQMGKVTDPTSLAPDLRLANGRLKPDYITIWLRDPNALAPGTRMPAFFPEGQSPSPDILGGDAARQMRALRDIVWTLGGKKPA